MADLLVSDKYGRLVSRDRPEPAQTYKRRRSPAALEVLTGDQYAPWAGRDISYITMPGGAMLQFDLSRLSLADFRAMRDHYQIGASLTVLTFVLHSIDWHIKCDDQEIADMIEDNLRRIWTRLIRALSQSFWCGYSPNVLNFENDIDSGYVIIDKIKDLVPEECRVNWKKVDGWAPPGGVPPTLLQYDGIIQGTALAAYDSTLDGSMVRSSGTSVTVPPENSLWYPLLMENGDYYGRKLLRPAFPAWYFSQIIHLFANRYYERFGEPTPVGRANFDEEVDTGQGSYVSGKVAMEQILANLRNRSVVVLPSDRDPVTKDYDWSIEYLESQMRGADFERYLSRLDEEMSLAVFTPMLLFRTANVGSYNLGQAHLKIFLWMLNHIAGDLKYFIQRYLVDRLHDINFGPRAPKAEWVYRNLGKDDPQLYAQMLQAIVSGGMAVPDYEELGTAIGLTINEIKQVTEPPPAVEPGLPGEPGEEPPAPGEIAPKPSSRTKQAEPAPTVIARHPTDLAPAHEVLSQAVNRAATAYGRGNRVEAIGYRNHLVSALVDGGADGAAATALAERFYGRINAELPDYLDAFGGDGRRFATVVGRRMTEALDEVVFA